MFDHPVYLRLETENDKPYFENRSCAEAVIGVLMNMQQSGWIRLHGFVLLPNALELVASLIRQGVSSTVAELQAESIPLLSVLLPQANLIWSMAFTHDALKSQGAFDARLEMLKLSPVAHGITEDAHGYPYSSANVRYKSSVTLYAGFKTTGTLTLPPQPPTAASTPAPASNGASHSSTAPKTEKEATQETATAPADGGSANAQVPL